MVNSIVKQSIDLRLNFEVPPRLTASAEICVLCGMLCRLYNLQFPNTSIINSTEKLKEYVLANISPEDERTDRLITLLSSCNKESEIITQDWVGAIKYGYDNV